MLPYDYYGAYGKRAHQDYAYSRLLGDEYTFDFPPHHDVVGAPALGAGKAGHPLGLASAGGGGRTGRPGSGCAVSGQAYPSLSCPQAWCDAGW